MTNIVERIHYDDLEDKLTIERVQDVQPIIEANKRDMDFDNRRHKSETMNLYARVPLIMLEKWAKDNGISYYELMNNDKLLKSFLNDPDNAAFRVRRGRI